MGILVGFLPFLGFALSIGALGATIALGIGAAISAVLIVRARAQGKSPKLLEVGTLILFGVLAAYTGLAGHTLSLFAVRLCVDSGLFAIVGLSLIARRPFTLQYAREQVPQALWQSPTFIHTNNVISAVWLAAFFAIVVAEAAIVEVPAVPEKLGIVVVIGALLGAFAFTGWYTKRAKGSVPA